MVGLDGKCFYNCADLRCYIISVFSVDTFCTLFMTAESNFLIDLVHNFCIGIPMTSNRTNMYICSWRASPEISFLPLSLFSHFKRCLVEDGMLRQDVKFHNKIAIGKCKNTKDFKLRYPNKNWSIEILFWWIPPSLIILGQHI